MCTGPGEINRTEFEGRLYDFDGIEDVLDLLRPDIETTSLA